MAETAVKMGLFQVKKGRKSCKNEAKKRQKNGKKTAKKRQKNGKKTVENEAKNGKKVPVKRLKIRLKRAVETGVKRVLISARINE